MHQWHHEENEGQLPNKLVCAEFRSLDLANKEIVNLSSVHMHN